MDVDDENEVEKRRNEELNIMLVVVSSASFESPNTLTLVQMGLLAATTTSFILYIQPQLQRNSCDESADLLRMLLYNTNKTVFGNNPPPTLPIWAGPPTLLTVAQIILYWCLAATLFAGLYAITMKFVSGDVCLGWKNRIVQAFSRWYFFSIYLLLGCVIGFLCVALALQVPFLPNTSTVHFGVLGKNGE